MAGKRKAAAEPSGDDAALGVVVQRQKTSEGGGSALAVKTQPKPFSQKAFQPGAHQRTSSLHAPIMLLEGHEDAVTCIEFSPGDGDVLATGGADKTLLLWNVRGENENFAACKGHKNAILDLRWTADGNDLVTCSPDTTLRLWDATTGQQTKTMKGHSGFVNACDTSKRLGDFTVVSGGDDRSWKMWDLRQKKCVFSVMDGFPVTAVAFGADGLNVYTAGIEEVVKQWDVRTASSNANGDANGAPAPLMTLKGHADTITGLRLSPDGSKILSNSTDGTMKTWDIRPYCEGDRCVQTFAGHVHNFEKTLTRCTWSPNGEKVASGSACRNVFVWDAVSAKIEYKLPGHLGSVHAVNFHPNEPILGSAGAVDVRLGPRRLGEVMKDLLQILIVLKQKRTHKTSYYTTTTHTTHHTIPPQTTPHHPRLFEVEETFVRVEGSVLGVGFVHGVEGP